MSKNGIGKIRVVKINNLPIDLYKVLKLQNIVQSGGEAKHVIGEGLVYVNDEVETRKSKKIFSGDIVTFAGEKVQIATNEGVNDNDQK